MRVLEALFIILALIIFVNTSSILLIDQGIDYEHALISYNRILAYQLLNEERINRIIETLTYYPDVVYISLNGNLTFIRSSKDFIITVRAFLLGENGTLKPSWVIIGVEP